MAELKYNCECPSCCKGKLSEFIPFNVSSDFWDDF